MATDPITVVDPARVDPAHIAEATAWVQTGVNLANKYAGLPRLGLGARRGGVATCGTCSTASPTRATLEAWERSPERSWWLSTGEGFVAATRVERRTGIEGWFDEPRPVDHGARAAATGHGASRAAPPRWKQAVTIWLGFFPVNLLFAYVADARCPAGTSCRLAARARHDRSC